MPSLLLRFASVYFCQLGKHLFETAKVILWKDVVVYCFQIATYFDVGVRFVVANHCRGEKEEVTALFSLLILIWDLRDNIVNGHDDTPFIEWQCRDNIFSAKRSKDGKHRFGQSHQSQTFSLPFRAASAQLQTLPSCIQGQLTHAYIQGSKQPVEEQQLCCALGLTWWASK